MRVILIVLIITIIPPATLAAESGIEFNTPAQFHGTHSGADWSWVGLAFFDATLLANGSLEAGAEYTEHQKEYILIDSKTGPADRRFHSPLRGQVESNTIETDGQFLVEGRSTEWSTILLHGKNIRVLVDDAETNIQTLSRECETWEDSSQQKAEVGFRVPLCPGSDVVNQIGRFHYNKSEVQIEAELLDWIEWHNIDIGCIEGLSPCPSSARTETTSYEPTPQDNVQIVTRRWTRATDVIDFHLSGLPSEMFAFGMTPTIEVNGTIRLPGASVPDCETCFLDTQSTMSASGNFLFQRITSRDEKRVSAHLSGDAFWLHEDERPVDPKTVLGPGAAVAGSAALIGLLGGLKFLTPLFTRISGDKALEHPRRQLLYAYIQENPGATFREVVRETDIPAGTARHHLTILRRSGLLAERRHRSTLRFFENHGRYDETWGAVVLRREAPLRALHDWLLENPLSPQKAVLEAMAKRGWSRSTTQHRLNRLLDGGLASVRPQGRRKLYEAHETARPDPDRWNGLGGASYS